MSEPPVDEEEDFNPFRPGAGHSPPHLAGRTDERQAFLKLIRQRPVMKNLVLTGLRGVGKTVLLEEFKAQAAEHGWLWLGDDLSESASLTEERLITRLLTDLAAVTSTLVVNRRILPDFGFSGGSKVVETRLTFDVLSSVLQRTPGLASDKLKSVLELVCACLAGTRIKGIVFAYDEAQNLDEHAERDEYPVSLLLDVFQSLQKKQLPLLLVLTGLPTLYPTLVNARTFAERMFQVLFLDRLNPAACRDAILLPLAKTGRPKLFAGPLVTRIVEASAGYPYFIQYLSRESHDIVTQQKRARQKVVVNLDDVTRKLDLDFFAGRWSRVTDRQRDLLRAIAHTPGSDDEFTVQHVVRQAAQAEMRPFSASQVTQMLARLAEGGLVYKNRHGKYSFAVPLFGSFIRRLDAGTVTAI